MSTSKEDMFLNKMKNLTSEELDSLLQFILKLNAARPKDRQI